MENKQVHTKENIQTENMGKGIPKESNDSLNLPERGNKVVEKWVIAILIVLCLALVAVCIVFFSQISRVEGQLREPDREKEAREPSSETILGDVANSVLYLEVYDDTNNITAVASGFIIEDGKTLVTNYHVIDGAHHIVAWTADGSKSVEIHTVLSYDENADLAILKCEKKIGVQALTLGNSDKEKQGDTVYAVGYPLGLANTLSDGVISSRYFDENGVDLLQITAAISNGSSGGALFNEQGEVIGVVCAFYVDGQNLNIGIAANEVSELLSGEIDEIPLELFYTDGGNTAEIAYDSYYVQVRTISVPDKITAEYILEKWKRGPATEEYMISIMNQYGGEQGGGQLYTIEPGQFVEEIDAWCFDRSRCIGDVEIIENAYGFSVCYFSGIIERKVLTVGTSADFPPFEYYDEAGNIIGIEMLLTYAIAEELGYEYELVDMSFDGLMLALANGEINCVAAGIEETEERNQQAKASIPWYEAVSSDGEKIEFVLYVTNEALLDRINGVIKKLKNDGTIDAIIEYYEETAGDGIGSGIITVNPETDWKSYDDSYAPFADSYLAQSF